MPGNKKEYAQKYYQKNREKLLLDHRESAKKWARENPERKRENRKRWARENPEKAYNPDRCRRYRDSNTGRSRAYKKYGITPDQYETMIALNGGNCWFCDKPRKEGGKRLAVEHCHETGRVRGLVHWHCNSWYIGKNNLESARRLVQYLENNFDGRTL